MKHPSDFELDLMPAHTARKEWYKLLTLIDQHRLNTYISVAEYAKMLGQSYGWTHLLLNPYHRNNQGKPHPTYPIDVASKLAQVLELEIFSTNHGLEQTPLLFESARKRYRLSYAQLAKAFEVNTMTVHRWLNRKTPMPTTAVVRMLDLFNLEPLDIAGNLMLHPADALRKPRGAGKWAKASQPPTGGFTEVDGVLVPKPAPQFAFTIDADGSVKWAD